MVDFQWKIKQTHITTINCNECQMHGKMKIEWRNTNANQQPNN